MKQILILSFAFGFLAGCDISSSSDDPDSERPPRDRTPRGVGEPSNPNECPDDNSSTTPTDTNDNSSADDLVNIDACPDDNSSTDSPANTDPNEERDSQIAAEKQEDTDSSFFGSITVSCDCLHPPRSGGMNYIIAKGDSTKKAIENAKTACSGELKIETCKCLGADNARKKCKEDMQR